MCTVTWIRSASGYELLSNRDEKRTRAPARRPRILEHGGVRFIAPIDGDCGGTWVGVNEFGLALCLLNGTGPARGRTSRGLLVLDLLTSPSLCAARERVLAIDASAYGPFTLVMIELEARTAVCSSDGSKVRLGGEPQPPLVSSSFDPAGVERARRRELAHVTTGTLDAPALQRYHQSHGAAPSAYSPCMHRPDAETVSFSRIRVAASEVEFYYTPAAPCRGVPEETVRLPATRHA